MKQMFLKISILCLIISSTAFSWDSMELASAKLYIKQKNYAKALEFLIKEVEKNPKSEDGWYYMAVIYNEFGQYYPMKTAIDSYAKVSNKKLKDLNLMKVSAWAKVFNKGVEFLNNAIDDSLLKISLSYFDTACYVMPESTMNFRNRAIVYYRLGDYDKAVPDFIAGSNNYTDNLSVKLLGDMYLEQASSLKNKFTEENVEIFENLKNLDLIREKIKSADVKYYLGQPTSVVKQKGKKKIEDWNYDKFNLIVTVENNQVTKVVNNYIPKIDSSKYFNSIKSYSKAIEVLKIGMDNFPDDPKISESLMNSYIGSERNDEARNLLSDRIKKYPDSKFDHYNLGVFLLKENNFEDAINEFKTTLNLDPTMSAAQYNLAASYVNWGVREQERLKNEKKENDKSYLEKYKMALPFLEKILIDKPNDVQMWELLGQVQANLGEMKKADEAYKKADAIREGKN